MVKMWFILTRNNNKNFLKCKKKGNVFYVNLTCWQLKSSDQRIWPKFQVSEINGNAINANERHQESVFLHYRRFARARRRSENPTLQPEGIKLWRKTFISSNTRCSGQSRGEKARCFLLEREKVKCLRRHSFRPLGPKLNLGGARAK